MYLKCNDEKLPIIDYKPDDSIVKISTESAISDISESIIQLYSDDDMLLIEYNMDDYNIKVSDNVITLIIKSYIEDIEFIKASKIEESKYLLARWLNDNPIRFVDGKFYTVTEEKQTLLNSNLASYERAKTAGIEYPLKWNSTGEECVSWEYESLIQLSLTIAAYVAPKIAIQQATELQIKACTTSEEINNIIIDYKGEIINEEND